MKHIYNSIDFGSDTIKIVVAELYQNKINLLASSSYKSKGIKKGLITDVKLATESVKGAINEIEEMQQKQQEVILKNRYLFHR